MTLLHIIRKLNVLRVYNKSVTYHTIIFTTVTGPIHHILLESNRNLTRMHSSRMRTVRNSSRLLGRGAWSRGVPGPRLGGSAPGGCLVPGAGVSALEGCDIPACTEADPPL